MEGGCIITFTADYFIYLLLLKTWLKSQKKGKTNIKEHIIYGQRQSKKKKIGGSN
jgi:hypothetical protein